MIIALVWSCDTSVPTNPPWSVSFRIREMISGVNASGVIVESMIWSARNPSSVISFTKAFGVHNDWTPIRSMPGRYMTACVTS